MTLLLTALPTSVLPPATVPLTVPPLRRTLFFSARPDTLEPPMILPVTVPLLMVMVFSEAVPVIATPPKAPLPRDGGVAHAAAADLDAVAAGRAGEGAAAGQRALHYAPAHDHTVAHGRHADAAVGGRGDAAADRDAVAACSACVALTAENGNLHRAAAETHAVIVGIALNTVAASDPKCKTVIHAHAVLLDRAF